MPRKIRIENRNYIYHVSNRGNDRSFIFESESVKDRFVTTLAEAARRSGWRVLAYSVLSNSFHLCLATPKGNLSEGMRWLQATFATRMTGLRRENGPLFQGRFRSLLVEPGEALAGLVNYIHLNPQRAGLETAQTLGSYRWSSLALFPKRRSRPEFLDCAWLNYLHGIEDSSRGWVKYAAVLKCRAADDPVEVAKLEIQMNRGWYIGSLAFKNAVAVNHFKEGGDAWLDHAELKKINYLQWEHALKSCLKALGKRGTDVANDQLSATWKLAIARRMKRETPVTNRWLSERLRMGHPNAVSGLCGIYQRTREATCPNAKRLDSVRFGH